MLTLLLAEERNFSLVRKLHKRKTTDHVGKKITLAKQYFVECKRFSWSVKEPFLLLFSQLRLRPTLFGGQFHQIATALGHLGHGD